MQTKWSETNISPRGQLVKAKKKYLDTRKLIEKAYLTDNHNQYSDLKEAAELMAQSMCCREENVWRTVGRPNYYGSFCRIADCHR
ncbi:MAG: hypothetical protein A2Z20_07370 [Bdellovibrionales bacterium RBG_16_40_8]|nr:MAG: hypothetical protein A2Z20_07370 [Bdellovibrionales bacterium RBG_16_40_8]